MGWEMLVGLGTGFLGLIGALIAVSRRWGRSSSEAETAKEEVQRAKEQFIDRLALPTPDRLARARAARRRLRELRRKN